MFSQRSNLLLSMAGIILLMGPATTTARAIDTPENQHHEQKKQTSNEQSATTTSEGPAVTAEIEVGPFDLKQKYRSMEGPYVRVPLKIADILAEKNVSIPDSYVKIPGAAQAGPGMTGSADGVSMQPGRLRSISANGASMQPGRLRSISADGASMQPGRLRSISANGASMQPGRLRSMSNDRAMSNDGAGNAANQKRELLWLKSVKIDMLDENDKPLPDAAFFCHATIDVDLDFRNQVFPASEHPGNMRHIVLTQGQTQFAFPNGFALPVASDESWNFVFQTINRTSDVPRKVKGRCLLTFVKDSELVYPIKALFWYYPVINVVIDRNSAERIKAERKSCPDCSAISEGVPAPSSMRNMIFTDKLGRSQIGHWVVPPGVHTYASPINTIGSMSTAKFAAADTDIHLVLTHVHPFCEKCVLIQHDKGQTKEIVTVKAKTDEKNLQLTEIDTISSVPGIPLEAGKSYELQATYNNTSSKPQDSMAGMALYCSDNKFVRPDWALAGNMNEAYCGTSYEQKSRKKAHSKAFGMRPN